MQLLISLFSFLVLGNVNAEEESTLAEATIPASKPLLSENDEGYKTLEVIQQKFYTQNPAYRHKVDYDEMVSFLDQLSQEIVAEDISKEMIAMFSDRVSTKYEMPGVHFMLKGYYDDVQAAASSIGYEAIPEPILGSLPIKKINVIVGKNQDDGRSMILFNIRFFEFAYEIAKVVAKTIVMREEGQYVVIDSSEEAFYRALENNPEILHDYLLVILEFLELGSRERIKPDADRLIVLSLYHRGIEMFAMAHEIGHVLMEHDGKVNALEPSALDGVSVILGMESSATANWLQELEADYVAAQIMIELSKGDISNNRFIDVGLRETPEFYFITREIYEDLSLLLSTGKQYRQPGAGEETFINFAVDAVDMDSTDGFPESFSQKFTVVKHANVHPHPTIRRQFWEEITDIPTNNAEQEAILAITDIMNRNAILLWERIRPVIVENREEIIKLLSESKKHPSTETPDQ
ncbi:hypothetical protein [Cerasicoccus frondis]|uniref:hypothetical protein n=1 Tax=Cerasicoccus frondis TaxID=490090 RepID=UPI002852A4E4|nr:hypothetical protein [Cerasicoccus frondis]